MKTQSSVITAASLLIMVICLAAISGFHLGKHAGQHEQRIKFLEERVPGQDRGVVVDEASKAEESVPPNQENVMLPADLAKAKNVPEKISRPEGDYTLVSVIEGSELNQQMTENLSIVTARRQNLANAERQFEQTPIDSQEQRELLATQINQMRNTLTQDLRVLARSYAYSLENTYVRVPHVVSLFKMSQVAGEDGAKLVHRFSNADDYAEFQQKYDAYLRMKAKLSSEQDTELSSSDTKTANDEPSASGSGDTVDSGTTSAADVPLTPELEALRSEMIELYQFDPESQYLLQFEKTALYARPAN